MGIMAFRVLYQDINSYSTPTLKKRNQRVTGAKGVNEGNFIFLISTTTRTRQKLNFKKIILLWLNELIC